MQKDKATYSQQKGTWAPNGQDPVLGAEEKVTILSLQNDLRWEQGHGLLCVKNAVGFIITCQAVSACPISLSSLGVLFSSLHVDPVERPVTAPCLLHPSLGRCPLEIHMLKS